MKDTNGRPECPYGHGPMERGESAADGRQWWNCRPSEDDPSSCRTSMITAAPAPREFWDIETSTLVSLGGEER